MPKTKLITPGEWDFACDSYGKVRHSRKACVYTKTMTPTGEQFIHIASRIPNWEDARLIAAAPELLTAIEQFIRYCESGNHPKWATYLETGAGAKMRAAVNKVAPFEVYTPAPKADSKIEDVPMPWHEECQSYHHDSAPCYICNPVPQTINTELLSALEAILAYEDDLPGEGTFGEEVYRQAKDAVHKARGGK